MIFTSPPHSHRSRRHDIDRMVVLPPLQSIEDAIEVTRAQVCIHCFNKCMMTCVILLTV